MMKTSRTLNKSLWQMFTNTVAKHGDKPMFHINPYNSINYNNVFHISTKYREFLKTHGIKKGDNIVVIGKSTPNWVALMYAINSVNATFVPMYLAQQPHITSHMLSQTNPVLIFNSTNSSINNKIPEINHETFTFDNNFILDTEPELDPNAIATILYTSGTSGLPKGVPLTNLNILSNLDAINMCTQRGINDVLTCDDKFVSFLPWVHCYGKNCELHSMVSAGASMYRNDKLENLRKDMVNYNPTVLCSVPRLFQLMHKKISWLNSSFINSGPKFIVNKINTTVRNNLFGKNLRYATVGGSSISQDLLNFYNRMDVKIHQGYGTTECSPMISLNNSVDFKPGSVGKILDCNKVKIDVISEECNDARMFYNNNQVGEILVNGSNVMLNYLGYGKEESFVNIEEDYWYKTGDVGYVENDFLFLTGRIKEQYKLSNGKFVNPADVEEALLTAISEIQQIVVFGKDDDFNSAIIVSNKSEKEIKSKIESISLTGLIGFKLKKYEIPQKIIITKEPFTTENGLLTQKKSQKRDIIIKQYT